MRYLLALGFLLLLKPAYAQQEALLRRYHVPGMQLVYTKAEWSMRTVGLAPRAAYYDTVAHLRYRLRYFAEAMQQAVVQTAPDGMNFSQFEQELVKMKKRQLA